MPTAFAGQQQDVSYYLQITEGDWERATTQPTGGTELEKRGAEKGRKTPKNDPKN